MADEFKLLPTGEMCARCMRAPREQDSAHCVACIETRKRWLASPERKAKADEKARVMACRWRDKPENKIRFRQWELANPKKVMLIDAKKRAKERSLAFDITADDFVIPEVCPLLGIRLEPGIRYVRPQSPTLDRIISERGYVRGNVWVISHRANTIKQDASLEELKRLVHNLERLEWS